MTASILTLAILAASSVLQLRVIEAAPKSPAPSGARAWEWSSTLDVAGCPAEPPILPQDSAHALDATLLVRAGEGVGSAVLISDDGFALTAAHVAKGRERVDVVRHDGTSARAEVVRVNRAQDVALLRVEHDGPTACLRLGEGEATLGADVFVLGSPAGEELSFSVAKGIVSGYRTFDGLSFVQLDASLNPGNSGGPAVTATGFVIGIASWKVSHVAMEGLAFAVPAPVALRALGVQIADVSDVDWQDKRGQIGAGKATPRAGGDAPTPKSKGEFDVAQIRRTHARRGLIGAGASLAGTGALLIASTYLAYRVNRSSPAPDEGRWKVQRGINVAGWTLAIGGAVGIVAGLAIPKRTKRQRRNVALSPTGNGLALSGEF